MAPWCASPASYISESVAVVIKQFQKAAKKLYKKLVILSAAFRNLFMVKK
jgi:hypothetical protein